MASGFEKKNVKKNAFVRSTHPTPQGQNYHGRSDGIRSCVIAALILT